MSYTTISVPFSINARLASMVFALDPISSVMKMFHVSILITDPRYATTSFQV